MASSSSSNPNRNPGESQWQPQLLLARADSKNDLKKFDALAYANAATQASDHLSLHSISGELLGLCFLAEDRNAAVKVLCSRALCDIFRKHRREELRMMGQYDTGDVLKALLMNTYLFSKGQEQFKRLILDLDAKNVISQGYTLPGLVAALEGYNGIDAYLREALPKHVEIYVHQLNVLKQRGVYFVPGKFMAPYVAAFESSQVASSAVKNVKDTKNIAAGNNQASAPTSSSAAGSAFSSSFVSFPPVQRVPAAKEVYLSNQEQIAKAKNKNKMENH